MSRQGVVGELWGEWNQGKRIGGRVGCREFGTGVSGGGVASSGGGAR